VQNRTAFRLAYASTGGCNKIFGKHFQKCILFYFFSFILHVTTSKIVLQMFCNIFANVYRYVFSKVLSNSRKKRLLSLLPMIIIDLT